MHGLSMSQRFEIYKAYSHIDLKFIRHIPKDMHPKVNLNSPQPYYHVINRLGYSLHDLQNFINPTQSV